MRKTWQFEINNVRHTVELEHRRWTNKQNIALDGQQIYKTPTKFQVGGVTRFVIDGHLCAIVIRNRGFGYAYDLIVDGVSVTSGKQVRLEPGTPVATLTDGVLHRASDHNTKGS